MVLASRCRRCDLSGCRRQAHPPADRGPAGSPPCPNGPGSLHRMADRSPRRIYEHASESPLTAAALPFLAAYAVPILSPGLSSTWQAACGAVTNPDPVELGTHQRLHQTRGGSGPHDAMDWLTAINRRVVVATAVAGESPAAQSTQVG